jgi:hypothetical protein
MGLPFHGKQGDYDAGVELMAEGLPVQSAVSPHVCLALSSPAGLPPSLGPSV